ncbi:IGFALS [Symbiodinium natans]|uniref:IGFALS protein n=1 Tax=Symbiodinium natans TaxID=878477 RepID=A0A812RXE6_9DINO|nr:IGFALS [Symbiodinium natans]
MATLFALAVIAVMSIWYTTVRLNRMEELSKQLEVRAESVYAKHLGSDLSDLFGDQREVHISHFHVSSLQEHYLEARRHSETFRKRVCLPLSEFMNSQILSGSLESLQPKLKPVPLAREAIEMKGDPSRVYDILYCHVTLPDLTGVANAWHFLKVRLGNDDSNVIEIMSMRDSFALAQAGHRCAEIVVRIHSYFATIRFFEGSLNELQAQLDVVHRRAKQLGLVASKEACRRQPASRTRPWFLDVSLCLLRTSSLLAAVYLAGQYFARYSPTVLQSRVRHSPVWQYVFALKNDADPPAHPTTWAPCMVFTLPYLVLTFVLVCDLQRCRARVSSRSLTPIQLLYENDFGIHGRFYSLKVAALQFFTVMLQALGKLPVMGGIASFSIQEGANMSQAFTCSFWVFVAILGMNSLYPSILFLVPSDKRVRLGAGILDAILDMAYTLSYLVVTLLANYKLVMKRAVTGNFGTEGNVYNDYAEVVHLEAKADAEITFPTDFVGFFAVYYSVAHVCSVCRALEQKPPKAWLVRGTGSSLRSLCPRSAAPGGKCQALFKVLYSPSLLLFIAYLVLSSKSYPNHQRIDGCFPCHCAEVGGAKQLAHCHVAGALRVKDLSLSNQSISSIAPHAFRSLHGLRRLSLSGNPLQILPDNLFAPLNGLEFLDLSRADLHQLESSSFAGLSALRVLALDQNQLQQLPKGLLHPMPALEKLMLGGKAIADSGWKFRPKVFVPGNKLTSLPSDAFERSLQLRVLDLSDNRLETLPEGLFSKNPMLQTLDLKNNSLRDLPADIFKGLSRLRTLDLTRNNLSKLPLGLFSSLGRLEVLDIRYTHVGELAVGVFAGLGRLRQLDIGHNRLSKVASGVFAGLKSLKQLFLSHNPLRELPLGTFAGLPSLEVLDVRGTSAGLRAGIFAGLPKLQTLILENTSIHELPAGVFAGLGHLKSLGLSHNPLGKLPVGSLAGLGRLEILSMSNTSLTELGASVFLGLQKLEFLFLSGNLLTQVPVGALKSLPDLRYLGLGDNSIRKLPVRGFASLPKLQRLALDDNLISELPPGAFAGLGQLKHLSLEKNPIHQLPEDIFAGLQSLTSLILDETYASEAAICSQPTVHCHNHDAFSRAP